MKDLALAVRFARRELRGGLKGFRVFLACLILGVAAIAGVGSFAAGITRALQEDARVLLGGDLELSFTHRSATPEQLAAMARAANVSTIAEMRAMARTDAARTLVELKAVDTAYPLLGTVGMDNGAPLQDALARRDGAWGAVLERATLVRLSLAAGDSFQVGDARFVVRAVIEREPDRTANVFTLGPRVMIALAALPDTGLIQPGSLVRYEYRLLVKQPGTGDRVAASLRDQFPDAGWRIRGLSEATPGVQRWIDRIAMFLTLVGLSALLVGGVGVANAVRAYLDSKTQTIAVFKCLGAPGRLVMLVYLVQVLALAALAIAIGLVIGAAIPSLVGPLVADKLPVAARTGLYPGPLAVAAGFGLLTTLAFTLWPVARTREVPAAALFRDLVAPLRRWPRPLAIVGTVLAVTALAALAIATAIDHKLAAGFVGGAIATFALFFAASLGVAWLARRARHIRRPELRLALANMHRPGSPMPSVMLSLGLGLTVMVLIAQAQGNFVRTLREQIPAVAPSFFFIDIQPDQIGPFKALLAGTTGVDAVEDVPALRGRIVRLAGVPVEQAPIAPEAQWAIGSDRGLTYSAVPPPGSRVVAGEWWPADYHGPPLVSFDAQIARGMGLNVGDTITINVLGRDVEARIANLRAIDWTSLGINFTLVFAPGTLEAAPHTYIAIARVAPDAEDTVERLITDRFPNISTIRVKSALATVEGTLESIASAARGTALIALLAGGLVLAGALAASHRRRLYDAVVLKVLGATRSEVMAAFLIEFGLLALAASVAAVIAGSACAYVLLGLYMRVGYELMVGPALATVGAAVIAVLVLGFAGTWRALGQKAAPILRHA
jgi:putative ABC transport system permease protein